MPQLTQVPQMLTAAQAAVQQTRSILANGNSNAYGAIPGTQFRSSNVNQQNAIREAVSEAYSTVNVATTELVPSPLKIVLCDAKIAIGQKAGNCDQHASVAFAYLFVADCWPVHKVHLPGHAFVVIGTPAAFVICDPWADAYGPGASVNQWLQFIWGANAPAFNTNQIVATWNSAGGSQAAFDLLTCNQPANDKMDFSD